MKYYVLVTFCLYIGQVVWCDDSSLKTDIDELEAMIPEKQIKKLTEGYAIHDLQFWKLAIYVKGAHFKGLWVDVLNQTGVDAFINFGETNGVNIVERINKIAQILDLPKYPVKAISKLSHLVQVQR